MPLPHFRLRTSDPLLQEAFDRIRVEFKVPASFPPEVLDEAKESAERAAAVAAGLPDATDLPFLTIDPPGSMDLDQAMHCAVGGDGYRVRYAIADLSTAVDPGGTIDAEARRRGQTIYLPDEKAPLHPPALSEDTCSLLPGVERAAYVWDLTLDATGEVTSAQVSRMRVRSVARYDYMQVQAYLDGGDAAAPTTTGTPETDAQLPILARIGGLRVEAERRRGGASLPMPDQEIDRAEDGTYRLRFRPVVPAEDFNAQISLMTGMAAAELMLAGGVGILRTMPAPADKDVAKFRRRAAALGVPWPAGQPYGEFLRTLDGDEPRHLALLHAATSLFRGAGYTPFDGTAPEVRDHSAIAAPYAHVTAPLRRLVDRFGLAVCAALSAGEPVPQWAREALPTLPDIMADSDRSASAVARACTDAAEAAELAHLVGQTFDAVVVDDRGDRGLLVQLPEPAVVAIADGRAELGSRVRVRLQAADVTARTVRFDLTG